MIWEKVGYGGEKRVFVKTTFQSDFGWLLRREHLQDLLLRLDHHTDFVGYLKAFEPD